MMKYALLRWMVAGSLMLPLLISCQATDANGKTVGEEEAAIPLNGDGGEASESVTAVDLNDGVERPPIRLPKFMSDAEAMPRTEITFDREIFDFGKVRNGETVTHRFKFRNQGKKTFHITRVKPACGCTAPYYSEAPVPPGGEGYIDIAFDTHDRPGKHRKLITITGNFEGQVNRQIGLEGEVLDAQSASDSTTTEAATNLN
ncbi:MAG: DUF1573 domain-containing protein [Bacteroidota bacterium]